MCTIFGSILIHHHTDGPCPTFYLGESLWVKISCALLDSPYRLPVIDCIAAHMACFPMLPAVSKHWDVFGITVIHWSGGVIVGSMSAPSVGFQHYPKTFSATWGGCAASSAIARSWRQPNYLNQLAPKRGNQSSLMFDPNPMWWANMGATSLLFRPGTLRPGSHHCSVFIFQVVTGIIVANDYSEMYFEFEIFRLIYLNNQLLKSLTNKRRFF